MLRKDFTIDETQVYESRAIGADAILLIVAALPDDGLLTGLRELAEEVGLVALVEAHDEAELDRALAAGAPIVGVNARDLGDVRRGSRSERAAGRSHPAARSPRWPSPRSAHRGRRNAWPRPASTPCSWARRSFAATTRPRSSTR